MEMAGYSLPATLGDEIDDLENHIARTVQGAMTDAELKAYRVPFGIYEQRIKGRYMVRIRCAAGMIAPDQLAAVAALAKRYGSGRLHITTRQEVQIHDLALASLIPVLRALYAVGLTSRGGGGNTVRNITASWDSGLGAEEVFDVTPYAVALTSRLIALADSWLLPRKFKIAFSNADSDTAYATVTDVGFVAQLRDGRRGFKVFVAGGLGRSPQPGFMLHEFIATEEVFEVAEALKRLFARHGNRRNKHTARLRFLRKALGHERFIALYQHERNRLQSEHPLPFHGEPLPGVELPREPRRTEAVDSEEFSRWKQRYCGAQSQEGLWWARFPLHLGDIDATQLEAILSVTKAWGEDCIRFSPQQNIVFRNIAWNHLPELFELARDFSPLSLQAPVLSDAVSCAGASTCQLGICLSRGVLQAIHEALGKTELDLDALCGLRINVSGCSNACGQHHLAHLGLFGKVARKNGHPYPVYGIVAGGQMDGANGGVLAQPVADIPARAVPQLFVRFFEQAIERVGAFESLDEYLLGEGITTLQTIAAQLQQVPDFEQEPHWYADWGSDTPFSLEGRGSGECAAGLFDLIELDLAKVGGARDALKAGADDERLEALLREVLFYSARALLVTKVGEIVSAGEVARLFVEHFVHTGQVAHSAAALVELLNVHGGQPLAHHKDAIIAFAETITTLYASLDESLHFPAASQSVAPPVPPAHDRELDLRGVACPINYVKTKMALSRLNPGQVLKVILDSGEPVENVPASAHSEGHGIVIKYEEQGSWVVLIKRGA
jgi:sulfite reductase (ferredoxin)